MDKIKKVVAIHDMSCYGRSSLTTIIPILSVMGVQVCPLPTAVLSTHTGGLGIPTVVDLSDFIEKSKEHWNSLNLKFDCIYTGYLADATQASFVKTVIEELAKENALIVIDPVMADNGKLYASMGQDMVEAMKELIKGADVITPNITEAALLLGENYDDRFNYELINQWAVKLADFNIKNVVITSVPSISGENYIDTICYNKESEKLSRITIEKVGVSCHGTGDAFASILTGAALKGIDLETAINKANNFITSGITIDKEINGGINTEISLEKVLKLLIE